MNWDRLSLAVSKLLDGEIGWLLGTVVTMLVTFRHRY